MPYRSGKIYTHSQGLSCAFRQWKASDSHCRYIHGYSLQVELTFERRDGLLDDRNWVMGFGDLKFVKKHLEHAFDHKTLVATDDPELATFRELEKKGMIQLTLVPRVGMESFCKMVFSFIEDWLLKSKSPVEIREVIIREHEGNWASYGK